MQQLSWRSPLVEARPASVAIVTPCAEIESIVMPFQPLPPDYATDTDDDQMAFDELCTAVEALVCRLVRSGSGVDLDSKVSDLGIEDELQDLIASVTAKHWCKDSSGAIPDGDEYNDYLEDRLRLILNCVVREVYEEAACRIDEEHERMPTRFEREDVI